jgi:hypothetical protein
VLILFGITKLTDLRDYVQVNDGKNRVEYCHSRCGVQGSGRTVRGVGVEGCTLKVEGLLGAHYTLHVERCRL